MRTPADLRRRIGHGILTLAVASTGSSLLWTASALPASAGVGPDVACADRQCAATFGASSSPQAFAVPAGVTSASVEVVGASGGDELDSQHELEGQAGLGGGGGRNDGTLAVSPGEVLTVIVGGKGRSADRGAGGGTGGGGGSFLFGPDDTLLLASGGGGGASGVQYGGQGGAAGFEANPGEDGADGARGGQEGTASANGVGGAAGSVGATRGENGSGEVTSATALPAGGRGGDSSSYAGGGGGGGYHAGGGGGGGSTGSLGGGGGAGGAGFASGDLTDGSSQPTNNHGDGLVVLRWQQPLAFTSTISNPAVGGSSTLTTTGDEDTEPVTFRVDPTTTNGACVVDRDVVTFTHAGTCAVAADQEAGSTHPAGHVVQSVVVRKGDQTITFALPVTATVGDEITLQASGGASGEPVTFSLDPSTPADVCVLAGATLRLTGKGTCTLSARQAGDDDYAPAAIVTHALDVTRVVTRTTLSFDPRSPVFGQPVLATATVAGAKAGSVQLAVDGDPFGPLVALGSDGTVTFRLPPLPAGGTFVQARFVPTDEVTYAGSEAEDTLTVAKARTKTTVTVRADGARVVVGSVGPTRAVPSGSVVFAVDGVEQPAVALAQGKATLATSIPAGRVVSVVYGGDDDFAGSSDSSVRADPQIVAEVSSARPRSDAGWYGSEVTISFTCTAGSAPIIGGCPAPVTLTKDGASQGAARTITAEDGGVATASVTGIDIDRTSPSAAALGVDEGDRFFAAAPEAGCTARDSLSGVELCTAGQTTRGKTVTYHVRAVDRAGNQTVLEVHARIYDEGILDAPYANGAYTVQAGKTYTLVANSSHHPRLLKATKMSKKPTKKGARFTSTGQGTWALGYTIGTSLQPGKSYHLGIQSGSQHVLTLHVVA